ncbi:lysophospholipid acyltransferase family protein [Jatrophihabitans endophyticus]|uniref:lysophospholipid acyltransferase family protein n=1 Tax=Jatrophihabitans endophyticus TaxID=1206085 RepID=UPI00190EE1F8|nr:lysophospholipid acyltransferase family protein [Jatrophihabitans endophyticus]
MPAHPSAYRVVLGVGGPVLTRWSRLRVSGLDCLPATGPVVLAADHDSYWDPIAIAVAARDVRSIRALSKSTLWRNRVVGSLMTGMGHIPVVRGVSNAEAMARAVAELRAGACIGMFPEGTRSLGCELRARSGVGRLAQEVPDALVVCVAVNGSTDVVRVPRRPAVSVEFFLPRGGQLRPGETAVAFAGRLLAELRERAPREIPGRRRTAATLRARAVDAGSGP